MNRYMATLGVLAAIGICAGGGSVNAAGANDDPDLAKLQADVALLMNAESGPAEIDSRLRKSLVVQDGIVMIHNQATAYGSYTFPATDPWAVQCGLGLTVTFGSTPRGDPNDIGTGPEIHLSYGQFKSEEYDKLGFLVGKKVQALVSGR